MEPKVATVAIAGGGPAGAVAALVLARRGVRAVVLEARAGPTLQVGETLPPSVAPLLRHLGLEAFLEEDGHLRSQGNRSHWGSEQAAESPFLANPYGAGWHVDRRRFAARLAEVAQEAGAEWRWGCRVESCVANGPGWRLEVVSANGPPETLPETLNVDFVADATGRAASLARRLGAHRVRYDRLVGLSALLESPTPAADTFTLVEAMPEGWWYSALLADGRLAVAFLSDGDLLDRSLVGPTPDPGLRPLPRSPARALRPGAPLACSSLLAPPARAGVWGGDGVRRWQALRAVTCERSEPAESAGPHAAPPSGRERLQWPGTDLRDRKGIPLAATKNRLWPLLATALTLAGPFTPAANAANPERFSGETTNVVAIEVPVEVVRGGEPVRGLTAADFEVSEGRRKLKITGFDVIDLKSAPTPPGAPAPAPLPVAARRHFLLLFDLSFSEPSSVLKARHAAADLVARSLHPTDLVAVATYSVNQGPRLVLGFTTDRRQIALAIDTLGVANPLERTSAADPLRLVYEAEESQFTAHEQLNPQGGRTEIKLLERGELLDTLKTLSPSAQQQDRQNQIDRVISLSRSLADLARMMATVGGRKYVLYLSEGFDSSLLTGTLNQEDVQQNNAMLETDPVLTLTEGRNGDTRTLNRMERMFDQFRRADCVIQAIDIGGLRGSGDLGYTRPNGQEALFTMAKETGGELFENWNDLGAAMGKMLDRTSVTYVLTLQPDDLKLDGAYHKLNVGLKNAPRGTRVVAKPGFYAPRPFAQRNPLERALDAADAIVGGAEGGTISTAVLAAPFHLAAGPMAYVPVLIEVDGKGLLASLEGTVAPAEIYAYALDASGGVRDFFSQTLNLDLGKIGPQLRAGGLKFFGHLDLPPGEYSVRVLVRNGRTGAYGLKVTPVEVPAFAQGPFLLPPFFPEPPGKWLMTREAPRGKTAENPPYPFLLQEEPYIPASRPVLGAGQDARVALVVYNLGAGEVKAAARVLGADGKEVQAAELEVTDRERGGAAAPDRLTASLHALRLQPGEYQLQVTLTDGGGGRETSAIPFVVEKPARPAAAQ